MEVLDHLYKLVKSYPYNLMTVMNDFLSLDRQIPKSFGEVQQFSDEVGLHIFPQTYSDKIPVEAVTGGILRYQANSSRPLFGMEIQISDWSPGTFDSTEQQTLTFALAHLFNKLGIWEADKTMARAGSKEFPQAILHLRALERAVDWGREHNRNFALAA